MIRRALVPHRWPVFRLKTSSGKIKEGRAVHRGSTTSGCTNSYVAATPPTANLPCCIMLRVCGYSPVLYRRRGGGARPRAGAGRWIPSGMRQPPDTGSTATAVTSLRSAPPRGRAAGRRPAAHARADADLWCVTRRATRAALHGRPVHHRCTSKNNKPNGALRGGRSPPASRARHSQRQRRAGDDARDAAR